MISILLIDDDPHVEQLLSRLTDPEQATIRRTATGEDGIAWALVNHPDLVILCVDVPQGFIHCRTFKKDPTLSMQPLLIISASARPETFEAHRRLPTRADAYLFKPLDDDDVRTIVSRLVGTTAVLRGERAVSAAFEGYDEDGVAMDVELTLVGDPFIDEGEGAGGTLVGRTQRHTELTRATARQTAGGPPVEDSVRRAVATMVRQYGPAVCNDVRRCEGLLKDETPARTPCFARTAVG